MRCGRPVSDEKGIKKWEKKQAEYEGQMQQQRAKQAEMSKATETEEQIQRLGGANISLSRREINELPNILWQDEIIEGVVQGYYHSGGALLVATTKRLIFISRGLRLHVEDFSYDKISSIQHETGLIGGSIKVFASGNNAEITNVPKAYVKGFADFVRAKISGMKEHPAVTAHYASTSSSHPPGEDIIIQIERLAKLKDQGILTEEEFQTKKQELLSKM